MARAQAAQPTYTLDDYRRDMGLPICAFNGVENPSENVGACDWYWQQWEREMLAQALEDAEDLLATHLHFYLGPHFLTDNDVAWTDPLQLRWGHVIGGGVQGLTAVTPSASDFTTDPATITVAQASFPGGTDEIAIVETSSSLRIYPDSVATSGTDYVISISQCKLIEWDDLEDQTESILYNAAFPATTWLKLADLTVYREYLDTSTQATITFEPTCTCWCGTACSGDSYTGCVWVMDEQIGKVRVPLANYSAGSWACNYPNICGCYHGSKVSVDYRAGTTDVPGWRRAVRQLAHARMPIVTCGCNLYRELVKRDYRIPPVLTAERINCAFGQQDGAWNAWMWCETNQHGKAFLLGAKRLSTLGRIYSG